MSTSEQAHREVPRAAFAGVRVRRRFSPPVVLSAALALLTVLAGLVAASVTVWALDETVLEESALHYTSNFPSSLLHDVNARATDRFYSFILSIPLRLFNGATAIQVDHVLSTIMFISAAVPVYLLARRMLRSPWSAVAVALLSVALPWLTITTALFTENLAYPLFWWAMLACLYALWHPGLRADLLALIAVGLLVITRVQFAGLFLGYVCAIVGVAIVRWRTAPAPRRLRPIAVSVVRKYPLTAAIVGLGILVLLYLAAAGTLKTDVSRALGNYSNVVIRTGLPPNMVEGLLVELIALALGVGVLPAIVSLTWYVKRVTSPRLDEMYVYLLGGGLMLIVFLILTVFSQFGYIGAITEERYFFYVVPAFWLGTFAALEERSSVVRAGELIVCAVALAAIFGSIPFLSPMTSETAFLAPAESVVQHVLTNRIDEFGIGLTPQDTLAILTTLAGLVVALVWPRRPRTRWGWILGIAVGLQLLITGYAYAVITGHVSGIPGRTTGSVSALGWVDSHTQTGTVSWLDNLSPAAAPAVNGEDQQRTTLFFNKSVTNWLSVPEDGLPIPIFPMSAEPGNAGLAVVNGTGLLGPQAALASVHEVVGAVASPFLQVAGQTIATSPGGGMILTRVSPPMRASWIAEGLAPDGSVLADAPAKLFAFNDASGSATRMRVTFAVIPPAASAALPVGRHTTVTVRLGSVTRSLSLTVGNPAIPEMALDVCLPQGTPNASGAISVKKTPGVASHQAGALLEHVIVSRSATTGCPR